MTGLPAATLLHLGPGLGNALANLHNARKACSPVVNIVGEHSTRHLQFDAPLTADIELFARTVSAYVRTPASSAEIGAATAECVAASRTAPGGVATLIVPADYSWSDAGEPGPVLLPPEVRRPDSSRLGIAREALRAGPSTGILLGGRTLYGRGLVAAGHIAAASGCRVFATRYAARMESGRGRFQPQRVPYFPEPAIAALAGLTQLILVEAKPPVSFFGYPDQPSYLAPENCRIVALAEPGEDGSGALEALAGEFAAQAPPYPASRIGHEATPEDPLTLESLGRSVAALLPDGAIVSDEMVSSGEIVGQCLRSAAPHDHLPVTGGSIGQGLPVALGAAVACPDRKVVALEADGSAMYTLQSLWTMARENADVTAVIFANRRYRILDVEMRRTGANGFGPAAENLIDIGKPDLDWVSLGTAMGVPSVRARTAGEFRREFQTAMRERGPRLIEAILPG